jgi:hypothetical protein
MASTTVIIPTLYYCPSILDINIRRLLNQGAKVHLIDNTANNACRYWEGTAGMKITYFPTNIGVNPAWNLGIIECNTPYYLLLNDDCLVWTKVIEMSEKILQDKSIGMLTYRTLEHINRAIYDSLYINQSESAQLIELGPGLNESRIGWFMYGRTKEYPQIPKGLKIMFGDDIIYKVLRKKGLRTVKDNNNVLYHQASTTVNRIYSTQRQLEVLMTPEREAYEKFINENDLMNY